MSCEAMSRRRVPLSLAAAPPLEDEDLLADILLRLPPQPSSLPRASAVSKQWRSLVSFPDFLRRFRIHHRRNPPLLGFFAGYNDFIPTMDPPNRVPDGRFSLQLDRGDDNSPWFRLLGCRHGLVLIFLQQRHQVLVWDPVTGDQHPIAIPPDFAPSDSETTIHGAVIRSTQDVRHFQVVMVGTVRQEDHDRAIAQVYSSESGTWGNLISTPLPLLEIILIPDTMNIYVPAVLVWDSLYWSLSESLLEFDLSKQTLGVIPLDMDIYQFSLMRADDGGLGLLFLIGFTVEVWKRKTDCDGIDTWELERTIQLDKLLSLNPQNIRRSLRIQGFAEDNNVLLLWTEIGLFTIQLESLQFKNLCKTNYVCPYYAFESVYTPGTVIGGGHDGAEL